jgi:hypothetical protein
MIQEIAISAEAASPPCPLCKSIGTIALVDGDTIPLRDEIDGLRATAKGMALSVDGYCFFAHLMLGVCEACEGNSYFVNLELIHAADVSEEWANKYFCQNEVITEPSSFARVEANLPDVPQAWVIERTPTPVGVLERHTLGPFISEDNLRGPNGVASCSGHDTWRQAAALIGRLWPRVVLDPVPRFNDDIPSEVSQ